MKKCSLPLLILLSGLPLSSEAFTSPETFQSGVIEIEEQLLRHSLGVKSKGAVSAIKPELLETIFQDKKNRVHADFDVPKYFESATKFWFSIYSQYTSQQVVVHDKENLDLVYAVLDFEPLHSSKINRFAKSKLQADLALERSKKFKESLSRCHLSEKKLSMEDKQVLESVRKAGIKIPKSSRAKKKLFKKLSSQMRTQTGQRDMVLSGVLRSLPYLPFLEEQFDIFDAPKELLAIAFVESSFNLKARSYAGAAGIWQFMPRTAAYFMPKRNKYIDYRMNPIISTISALHLLKQNKMILKRWDLAIPAYNFGTSHLVKARRKIGKDITLAKVLKEYEHDAVGFASKNYYAEVLAMARVLAYKDAIFPLAGYEKKGLKFKKQNLAVYVTKCNLRPKTFFHLLEKSSPHIKRLNAHFLATRPTYRPRKLVVSDLNLTSKKYHRVSPEELRKYYPKNLWKLVRKNSCKK